MDYKFELSDQMVAVIGEALSNAPFKQSAPVVAELQKQINDQQPPLFIPPAVEDKKAVAK